MPDLFVAKEKTKTDEKPQPVPVEQHTKQTEASPEQSGKIGFFTTFCMYPKGVTFENQEPHEEVILFLRRDFILNLHWIIITFVLLLIPLLFPFLASLLSMALPESNYVVFGVSSYYLVVIGYAILQFTSWFYNVGIVSNLRVVDIDLIGITNKNVAATGIHDIVDVEYNQNGFLATFFDYGNVNMQTQGLKPNFEFIGVPRPGKVHNIISDMIRG